MGVDLAPGEVAFRCNLVTVGTDESGRDVMVDFAAGHISSEQSHVIVAAVDDALGNGRDGVRFHPGVEYRHLSVMPSEFGDAECLRPHDLVDRRLCLLNVERTDEAGHQGGIDEKVTSLEGRDADIIGPPLDALGDEPFRLLLLPDHATPCAARTHTSDPVPYLLYGTDLPG